MRWLAVSRRAACFAWPVRRSNESVKWVTSGRALHVRGPCAGQVHYLKRCAGRQFSQAGLRLGQGEEFAPGTACSSACELRLLYSNEPVLGLEQGRQCVGGRKTGSFRGLTEGPSRVNEAARRYRAPSITNHVMMVRLNALLYFFESHP